MLVLNQEITINGRELNFVHSVHIKSSRNTFTDTAEITIQNRISERNQNKISDVIKKGSEVTIKLGYSPDLIEEFTGYVSQVIPDKTAVIRCENEAYNLKRISVGKDIILKATDLTKLFTAIFKITGGSVTTPISLGDDVEMIQGFIGDRTIRAYIKNSNIGDWKISKSATLIDVLAELQSKFKLYSYFRGQDLIVNALADQREKSTITANFQGNVPIGESSFNFKQADADRIIVKATSISRSGEINTIYAYYSGTPQEVTFQKEQPTSGNVNEFNIGGQSDLTTSDLKTLAQRKLEALSFDGCDGSITIYGSPSAQHGDICKVVDSDVPEKEGDYSIVEVEKRFGVGIGYRQDLKLGISL